MAGEVKTINIFFQLTTVLYQMIILLPINSIKDRLVIDNKIDVYMPLEIQFEC